MPRTAEELSVHAPQRIFQQVLHLLKQMQDASYQITFLTTSAKESFEARVCSFDRAMMLIFVTLKGKDSVRLIQWHPIFQNVIKTISKDFHKNIMEKIYCQEKVTLNMQILFFDLKYVKHISCS